MRIEKLRVPLSVFVLVFMLLGFVQVKTEKPLILAERFITGIFIMVIFSRKMKKMVHCTLYCPIGTIVNVIKPVNPFRMYIDKSCTLSMHCTPYCKYDALNQADIRKGKPGITCTYCGDCLAGCSSNSIRYKFFNFDPEKARNLYLILTITLHSAFLALARI